MLDSQMIGYWGMVGCATVGITLIIVENWFLKKRVRVQQALITDMREALKSADALITTLNVTNMQYSTALRQFGLIKEEEKRKLDG